MNPPSGSAQRTAKLQVQFDDLSQQHAAGLLGMWIFLATEVLFFGGLFVAYIVYRYRYSLSFDQASNFLRVDLGTANTIILLVSSFTMAVAVNCVQRGRRRLLGFFLLVTAVLGSVFLVIKLYEWHLEASEQLLPGPSFLFLGPRPGEAALFFVIYFFMTGLHALHLTIGVLLCLGLAVLALRGAFTPEHHPPVELVGLYWHYVDIVWLFLYPLLYLGGRHLR